MEKIKALHYDPALPTSCRVCMGEKIGELIQRVNELSPNGLAIKGTFDSADQLETLTPAVGDAYIVGGNLYIFTTDGWDDCGQVKGRDGEDGTDGKNGVDGEDGYSPVVSLTKTNGVTTLTIIDKTGAKTVEILDGVDGKDGADGSNGSGSGDMSKSVYDTDNSGVVDNAEALQSHPASYFAPADHKHEGVYAPVAHSHGGVYSPVDHTHDDTYAAKDHDHAGVYAPASHTHDYTTSAQVNTMIQNALSEIPILDEVSV